MRSSLALLAAMLMALAAASGSSAADQVPDQLPPHVSLLDFMAVTGGDGVLVWADGFTLANAQEGAATPPGPAPGQPLGLVDAYELALQTSERIGIAVENREQSIQARKRVISFVLPHVTGKYQYYRQAESPAFGAASGFSPLSRSESWVFVEQAIFSGFRELLARRQTEALIESRTELLSQERLDLFTRVAAAFYTALAAEASVGTLEDSVALQQNRLREVRARQEVGLARRTDALLIETRLADSEGSLIRARNVLDSARTNLSFLIGREVDAPLLDTYPAEEEPPPVETLIEQARAQRRDLASAEADVRAATLAVKVIEREAWPIIKGEGNYYINRQGVLSPVDWDIAVKADLLVYTGGDRKARANDARSRLRQAELTRDELKRSIAVDVTQAYLDLKSEESLMASLEAEVRSADENFNLLEEEYRQGLATNLEVQVARDLLQQALVARDQELYRRKAAWVRLHATAGVIPGVTLE
jgi:outer membrane protein TolC